MKARALPPLGVAVVAWAAWAGGVSPADAQAQRSGGSPIVSGRSSGGFGSAGGARFGGNIRAGGSGSFQSAGSWGKGNKGGCWNPRPSCYNPCYRPYYGGWGCYTPFVYVPPVYYSGGWGYDSISVSYGPAPSVASMPPEYLPAPSTQQAPSVVINSQTTTVYNYTYNYGTNSAPPPQTQAPAPSTQVVPADSETVVTTTTVNAPAAPPPARATLQYQHRPNW